MMYLFQQTWIPTLEHPDDLWVSADGNVMRVSPTRKYPLGYVLKPSTVGLGYLQVRPSIGGELFIEYVHRLVLNAFVGPAPKLEADHINGIKTDNRLINLRWLTRQANCARRWEHSHGGRGEHGGMAKLTNETAAWIKTRPLPAYEMAKVLGVCPQTVYNVINGVSKFAHV